MCKIQSSRKRPKPENSESADDDANPQSDNKIHAHPADAPDYVKGCRLDQLQGVFIEQLQYNSEPFSKQPAHKLKEFGQAVLAELQMTFGDFDALSLEEKLAAVEMCTFPPPAGSTSYFARVCLFFQTATFVCSTPDNWLCCDLLQSSSQAEDDDAQMDTDALEESSQAAADQVQSKSVQSTGSGSLSQSRSLKDEKQETSPAQQSTESTGRAKVTSHDCLSLISRFGLILCQFQRAASQKGGSYADEVVLCSFLLHFE
jgi:hypothetical protein